MESGLNNFAKRRVRGARGFVLLVLMAHAFFVSATHFHVVAGLDSSRASVNRQEEGRKAPLTSGEEQCLVCRLQRTFNNGLMRHATPEVSSPVAKPLVFPSLEQASAHSARPLSAKGRAPPLS